MMNGGIIMNIQWSKLQLIIEKCVNLIIFLVGILLVAIGVLASAAIGDNWETVLVSVGTSMIASAVVSFITLAYIVKRRGTEELVEEWGVCEICERRSEMNNRVDRQLEKACDHLDIVGHGLSSFRETKAKLLREKVSSGLKIRLITVRPDLKELKLRDQDEEKTRGSTAQSIRRLREWMEELRKLPNAQVEVRYCRTLPTEVYFRVDNYIYVGPYQFGRDSQRVITTAYRQGGAGFQYYEEYFEMLWNNKDFCGTWAEENDNQAQDGTSEEADT